MPHGEERPLHSWLVLPSQNKIQDTAQTAEVSQVEGQAQTTRQEEPPNDNPGNVLGVGENILVPAWVPQTSRHFLLDPRPGHVPHCLGL